MSKADKKIYYGDKVKTNDGSQGIVKFIGEILGKSGIFYGIDLIKGNGKNNGIIDNITYFKTKGSAKSGIFLRGTKLTVLKPANSHPFTLGERILCIKCNPQTHGIIRYIGIPSFAKTQSVHYGIQLEQENGNCDGTIKKVSYFACNFKSKFGIYCTINHVKKANDKIGNKLNRNSKKAVLNNKSTPKRISKKDVIEEKKVNEVSNNNANKQENTEKDENQASDKENAVNEDKNESNNNSNNEQNNKNQIFGTGAQHQYTQLEQEKRLQWIKGQEIEVYSSSMNAWCAGSIQEVLYANQNQPIDVFLVFYTSPGGEPFTKYLDRWSPFIR